MQHNGILNYVTTEFMEIEHGGPYKVTATNETNNIYSDKPVNQERVQSDRKS